MADNATVNGSLAVNGTAGSGAYDSEGAMRFVVVTVSIYSLLGILSLLLVRIVRRAKFRLQHHHNVTPHEEFHSVRSYLRSRPQLQMEGHRQKLMHDKTKAALQLWRTDIPSLARPLLNGATLHPPGQLARSVSCGPKLCTVTVTPASRGSNPGSSRPNRTTSDLDGPGTSEASKPGLSSPWPRQSLTTSHHDDSRVSGTRDPGTRYKARTAGPVRHSSICEESDCSVCEVNSISGEAGSGRAVPSLCPGLEESPRRCGDQGQRVRESFHFRRDGDEIGADADRQLAVIGAHPWPCESQDRGAELDSKDADTAEDVGFHHRRSKKTEDEGEDPEPTLSHSGKTDTLGGDERHPSDSLTQDENTGSFSHDRTSRKTQTCNEHANIDMEYMDVI